VEEYGGIEYGELPVILAVLHCAPSISNAQLSSCAYPPSASQELSAQAGLLDESIGGTGRVVTTTKSLVTWCNSQQLTGKAAC
jgi:hypothetical protein